MSNRARVAHQVVITVGGTAAPVGGTLVKVPPRAFAVLTPNGTGVLVHLGIDTVGHGGACYRLHAGEGDAVDPGDVVVTWEPGRVRAHGLSACCPVVVLDSDPAVVSAVSGAVAAGEVLLEVGTG